jgi:hypothetical protein
MSFLTDGAAVLPDVKVDARSPSGLTDTWDASDANQIRQALLDIRTHLLAIIADRKAYAAGTTPTKAEFDDVISALISAGLMRP